MSAIFFKLIAFDMTNQLRVVDNASSLLRPLLAKIKFHSFISQTILWLMTPFLIAIDGRSGSGKTALSEQLASKLHIPVLHLDEFGDDYHPFIGLPALYEEVSKRDAPALIIEGVGVINPHLDDYRHFSIMLETSDQERMRRMIDRDSSKFDSHELAVVGNIWYEAEKMHFGHTIHADILLDSSTPIDVDSLSETILHQMN